MSSFSKRSIWGGWIVFVIASLTYLLTMEPTASLWDCSEFIATSYKLEVGHPPGTPFFFLINRLGAIFAGDPSNVAVAINALSALESGLTIAFLFWTIAHLGRRLYRKEEEELTDAQKKAIVKKLLETTSYESFEVEYIIDESLIGGLVIHVDDKVIDSSIKTKLANMVKALNQISIS